jgi:glucose dehydrogenase
MLEADIVIIGGGMAGALMAAHLAEAGYSILVLEAGARVRREAALEKWAAASAKTLTSPYRDAKNDQYAPSTDGTSSYLGNQAFKSTYLRVAGGSTWHWQGSTPRLLPNDFKMRELFGVGVDWPIDYDTLEPYYAKAERELGVSGDHAEWDGFFGAHRSTDFPMPPIWSSYSDREFTRRLGDMTLDDVPVVVRRTPQARNSQPYQNRPPCAGNSTCIPLCPIGAKYDATVHLDRAEATKKVELRERCVVSRIVFDGSNIAQLEVKCWDAGGVKEDTARSTRGIYVLAAHAIESARLLLLSGARDGSGQIGRNLMDHPAGQIVGLAPESWYTFRGPPVTSGIDGWRDGPFRTQSAAWKLSLGNDGHGRFRSPEKAVQNWLTTDNLIGGALRKKVTDEGSRMFRLSWGIEQLPDPSNVVELDAQQDALGSRRAKLTYGLADYTRKAIAEVRQKARQLLERAGVTNIELDGDPIAYSGSGHIMGTCRMAASSSQGVVDGDCRSFEYPNLFIVGSAVFPTVGTANPSLTVAALALRAAERIRRSLGAA